MSPRIILFVGAPLVSSVDDKSCTLDRFEKTFCQFMGLDVDVNSSHLSSDTQSLSHPAWRVLPPARHPRQMDDSPGLAGGEADESDNFFRIHDLVGVNQSHTSLDASDTLTQFCEESLAIHDNLTPSRFDSPNQTRLSSNNMTTTSFFTNSSPGCSASPILPTSQVDLDLSNLQEIPSASQILSLNPQTVTLNLIVGIISVAQPRTITTRWGKQLSLVEVVVGDDTKSGFSVTFWLSPNVAESEVRQMRRQDVFLMHNVGLHVFRNKVYGQSLAKGLTRLDLFWRRDGGGYYSTAELNRRSASNHSQIEKTRRVKNWVLDFVGGSTASSAGTANYKSWDEPPDDTQ